MTLAAFRIIRTYTPAAFNAVMTALIVACFYGGAVLAHAWLTMEIPQ